MYFLCKAQQSPLALGNTRQYVSTTLWGYLQTGTPSTKKAQKRKALSMKLTAKKTLVYHVSAKQEGSVALLNLSWAACVPRLANDCGSAASIDLGVKSKF